MTFGLNVEASAWTWEWVCQKFFGTGKSEDIVGGGVAPPQGREGRNTIAARCIGWTSDCKSTCSGSTKSELHRGGLGANCGCTVAPISILVSCPVRLEMLLVSPASEEGRAM